MSLAPKVDALVEPHGTQLPDPRFDGPNNAGPARASTYLEPMVVSVVPTKHTLCSDGAYFVATNPTPGTGVNHALLTSYINTSALFVLKNNDQPFNSGGTGRRIYLDYLRLIQTGTAPASCVSLEFLIQTDSTSRNPTVNATTITPVNTNAISSNGTVGILSAFNAGALTVPAPAGGTAHNVSRTHISTGINVTGDEYVIQFGGVDFTASSTPLTAIRAAQPARLITHAPPVCIGPQQYLVIYRWGLTEVTNTPQYEYELAWWER